MGLVIDNIIVENKVVTKKVTKSQNETTITLNGTLVLDTNSNSLQILSGNQAGYSVQLPDATTLDVGEEFTIVNASTQDVILDDSQGSFLNTIVAEKDVTVILKDNSTAAGSWQILNQPVVPVDWTVDQGATNIDDNNVPHTSVIGNPHATTKGDVGLGNVDNTSDANKPVSTAQQAALDLKYDASNPSGFETPSELNSRDTNNRNRANHTGTQTASTISDFDTEVGNNSDVAANTTHRGLTNNPHGTTKAQVGLGNVDNTSDVDKPVSTAQQAALDLKYNASNPNGYETPAQLNTRDTNNRNRSNHTGTQLASTISDFQTQVSSNSDILANTAAIAADVAWKTFAHLTNLTATNINNSTSGTQMSFFNTTPLQEVDPNSILSFSSTGVTVSATGRYLVMATVWNTGASSRANPGIEFTINGTRTNRPSGSSYIRNANGHEESSNTLVDILSLTSGQTVGILGVQLANTGTITNPAGTMSFIIARIS